jgi:indoleamine 2,3-dioxygenase
MTEIERFWTPNEKTGFLPLGVPSTPAQLAASSSSTMRALGSVTPTLGSLSDDELDEFVASLPDEPDFGPKSVSSAECEGVTRAYVCLAAHLIHRPRFVDRRELPASVARPLWAFSEHLGRPPSLTYASYVLANFMAPVEQRSATEDLRIAQTPTGTEDEEWFVGVHLSVESAGGQVIAAIERIHKGLEFGDEESAIDGIQSIESCMIFAEAVMPTIRDHLDPTVFRNEIRPLLYGHDQIAFRGVPGEPTVMYIGETGAQSGMIRAADAVLGAAHSNSIMTSMNRFLRCAPPIHQQFFEHASAVGRRLVDFSSSKRVSEARRAALRSIARFRRTHLMVVTDFLVPEGKSLAERGTGGTEFQVWLKHMIDETEAAAGLG